MIDVTGKPVIGYDRASKDSKGREISVGDQKAERHEIADDRGINLGWEYYDNDKSAMPGAPAREGWLKVLDVIRSGEAGGLQVWDADRFSRSPADVTEFKSRLDTWGIQNFVLYAGEDEAYNFSDDAQVADLYAVIASGAKEGYKIRKRTKRALQKKRRRGELTAGPVRRFGYIDAYKGIVHKSEAKMLRDAYKRILGGESLSAVAREWAQSEFPNVRADGKPAAPWRPDKVRTALLRPDQAGIVGRDKDGRYLLRSAGSSIFTIEEHEKIVEFFQARKGKVGRRAGQSKDGPHRWLNRAEIVRCGSCESRMHLYYPANRGRRRDRLACRYSTKDTSRKGCGQSVDLAHLQDYVYGLVMDWWSDPARGVRDSEAIDAATDEARELSERLHRLDRVVQSARESYLASGREDDYREMEQWRVKRDKVREELEGVKSPDTGADVIDREKAERMWDRASGDERRAMAVAAVDTVWVYRAGQSHAGRANHARRDVSHRVRVVMR